MQESFREKMARLARQNKRPHPAEIPSPDSSIGLLSLPPELIDRIIAIIHDSTDDILYFTVGRRQHFGPHEVERGIRTIYRLRLVCKRLSDATSRVFMPVLRICFSESSLARAEEIIRHPRISRNLQGVEVVLDYRPDNLANDFSAFFALKVDEIFQLESHWDRAKIELHIDEYEGYIPQELDKEASRIFQTQIRDVLLEESPGDYEPLHHYYVLAHKRWRTVYDAWLEQLNPIDEEYVQDDAKWKLLRKGFRRFQTIHKEQHQLVTSGQFTLRILAICSTLAIFNFQFLTFSDDEHEKLDHDADWITPDARIIFDDEVMLTHLAKAPSWSHATRVVGTQTIAYPRMAASRLIWDIPVALCQSGVKPNDLNIRCFPVREHYIKGMSSEEEMDRLQRAFS